MEAAVSLSFGCCSAAAGVAGLDGVSGSFISVAALEPFLAGVAGPEGGLSSATSSFGTGDVGLVAVGVESAVSWVLCFFVFFFRPMIGA